MSPIGGHGQARNAKKENAGTAAVGAGTSAARGCGEAGGVAGIRLVHAELKSFRLCVGGSCRCRTVHGPAPVCERRRRLNNSPPPPTTSHLGAEVDDERPQRAEIVFNWPLEPHAAQRCRRGGGNGVLAGGGAGELRHGGGGAAAGGGVGRRLEGVELAEGNACILPAVCVLRVQHKHAGARLRRSATGESDRNDRQSAPKRSQGHDTAPPSNAPGYQRLYDSRP